MHAKDKALGKMATLLNSLFFVFNVPLLPKYRVKYYDYIVKWCSGVVGLYNWCVSLDIAIILTLILVWPTSWTPAVCGLIVCVCQAGVCLCVRGHVAILLGA